MVAHGRVAYGRALGSAVNKIPQRLPREVHGLFLLWPSSFYVTFAADFLASSRIK